VPAMLRQTAGSSPPPLCRQRLFRLSKNRNDGRIVKVMAQRASCRGPTVFEAVKTRLAMALTSGYASGKIRCGSAEDAECPKKVSICLSSPSETARYGSGRGTGAQG